MSAIPCSSVNLKTMADGTLRISFDIEPMHAQDAFRLFAAPGTPAAIAALQVGYAAVQGDSQPLPPTEKQKGGALSKLAGMWCKQPEFWAWVRSGTHGGVFWPCDNMIDATAFVRDMCDVPSRAVLDHEPDAAEKFNELIRGPFSKHLIARGITL